MASDSEVKRNSFSMYDLEKRAIDLVVSSIAIIIFSPIMLLITVAVKSTSKGPVLADTPKRVGMGGKAFFMYKFRSMYQDSYYLIRKDPKYKEVFEKYKANSYKLSVEEDPRITKIGKFIRKTSLDELPQFFNVFRGEMSIVGPRAYFPEELREQAINYPRSKKLIRNTLTIKPGITGPWQTGGRNSISFYQRIEMDSDYAKKRSILYDIRMMLKTPFTVLSRKGTI